MTFVLWGLGAVALFLFLLLVVASCVLAGMEEQEMGEYWSDGVQR